ncbi:MAG: DUF1858 domain-containing protein [candidate division KSB1 bacterium]|nr:DUF1858 domain-containing protein [candidate division KSB1 bacterium]
MAKPDITPRIKISELLKAFPELEDELIRRVPAFKKLKNPVLRRTVAKVTSLQQAARVGEVPVESLVNNLRQAVGQPALEISETGGETGEKPHWLEDRKIVKTVNAAQLLEKGDYPYSQIQAELKQVESGSILKLTSEFLPMPMMDKLKEQGIPVWSERQGELYALYVYKS